ncbi:MAG: type IV secretion system DNA-binding domain-containing protein [bacterium]|nr:type IV secretion system DNA-binding domain-containing protein [bacterium]
MDEITLFGRTTFRNHQTRFGIKTDDRRRHMYVLGKTGMGKTTLLENLILGDIYAGHGAAYIDPHGDTAEKLIDFIPSHRINDVIYFNPADMDYPIGFNILEAVDESTKHLVASGLMGVFKKIWPDVWSARMEYIMNNCILALLDFPGSTLLGINRLLVDKEYRKRVVGQIKDPVVRTFWVDEYSAWEDRFRNEAIAPIQNKVGQFLSASIIRNIVAQVKSTINIRQIMDERKIFIVNLAKGRIGEDNSRLLGGMLVNRIQLAAMERVDMPEANRQDFYLYVDEFQNFATPAFANILSEARKYRLNLTMAHQYIEQLDEDYVRPAVFGNVGTIVLFRVGAKDAEFLENEFMPRFTIEDLSNLTKFQVYLKLMINGVSSAPFSANTLGPIGDRMDSTEKVVRVTRERYSQPRSVIEEKVSRWAGIEEGSDTEAVIARMEATEAARGPGGGMGKKKPKVMYDYTCTRCKKAIQLPVKLDPSRPIYCDDCLVIIRGEKEGKPAPAMPSPKAESAPAIPPSVPAIAVPAALAPAPQPSHPASSPKTEPTSTTSRPPRRDNDRGSRPPRDGGPKKSSPPREQPKASAPAPISLAALKPKDDQRKEQPKEKPPQSPNPPIETPKDSSGPLRPPPPSAGTLAPGESVSFE